ncbi:hypothetical protein G6011_05187 [Alternaria panax]|uniref:Uncharacterized protein n=1 Tax=Alternaria panax TaxID=48097 RepID=A0AAD4I823_9PLEO|nr:hypothetical protein G6011_05187 [Alternaria panax]
MDSKGDAISSQLGDTSGKFQYSIVVEKHPDYMVVVVLESIGGSRSLYKLPEHLVQCFRLVSYGERRFPCKQKGPKMALMAVNPELGFLEMPENFWYKPKHGVNVRSSNVAIVCYDFWIFAAFLIDEYLDVRAVDAVGYMSGSSDRSSPPYDRVQRILHSDIREQR